MYSDMSEDDKIMYLEVLQESPVLPFSNFVSKGNIRDKVDIARPRSLIDREVFRLVRQTYRDLSTRLLPILGSAGTGKTHAYHSFKLKEEKTQNQTIEKSYTNSIDKESLNWSIIYIPCPPSNIRVLKHIYNCIIEELGIDIFKEVSSKLIKKWAKKKSLKPRNIDEIVQAGTREYPGIFADCVKGICVYSLDKGRQEIARRWLIGETLNEKDLNKLEINSIVEEDDLCLAMIKLITENLDRVFILYFDELESPYRMFGEMGERRFLEIIKRLYNEVKMLIIIIAVLKEIWPLILEIADAPLRSRMEQDLELRPFSLNDMKIFYLETMKVFWLDYNLNPPSNPLFPLNEKLIKLIFKKSTGNPRASIKLYRWFIEKIVNEKIDLEKLGELEEFNEEISPYSIEKDIEKVLAEEEYQIKVNSSSVAAAALKAVEKVGEKLNISIQIEFEPKIREIRGINETIAGLVQFNGKKWGLHVPDVNTFNKPGNVGAYYAVDRLRDAKNNEKIDKMILIVPENTSGEKFNTVVNSLGESLLIIYLNQNTAKRMIENALSKPTKEGLKIAEFIFGEIPLIEEFISRENEDYRVPTLFLSYSWESKKHRKWVLNLAEQLCKDGIDVKLDRWEVKSNTNIPLWMESSIEKADFILLICTNEYGRKANRREKGVGYEYTIINTDLFYTLDEKDRIKTICLLRSGNQREAIPRYLRTRYFLDFRDESNYSIEYENLLREIFEKPKYVKPKIGTPPKL